MPLTAVFDDLPDPRRDTRNKLHRLTDIPGHRHLCRDQRGRVVGGDRRVRADRTEADFFAGPSRRTTASPTRTPPSGSSPLLQVLQGIPAIIVR
jgi:hypothetical protein